MLQRNFYGLTASLRVLPNFIVIGVGRGGTTSLFHYLGQHNCITKSAYDEIGFFDDNFHLGLNWYRSMFPTKNHKENIIKKYGKFLTFEVTPWYIRRPWIANRIKDVLGEIKIIAVLRNPVDRTYSHYNLAVRDKTVLGSFEEVIEKDMKELEKSKSIQKNDDYFNNTVQKSFLARSFYAEQLENWFDVFDKKNILIISSENLAEKTQETMNSIFDFLNIENQVIPDLQKINVGKYPKMKEETREILEKYFFDYNENLFNKIEKHFNWNK